MFSSIFTLVILVITGVIVFVTMRWVRQITKDLPKRSLSEGMAEAAHKMETMKQLSDTKDRAARLRSEGLTGQATIISASDTGQVLAGDPVYRYELTVEVPGRASYTASHEQFTPRLMLDRIVPGNRFKVMVDKDDPNELNMEWV